MVIEKSAQKRVLLHIFKDFTRKHTITSLANEIGYSRVGIWKIVKKLESKEYVAIESIGPGKTSALIITINWENPLAAKAISLYLAEEAMEQRRWKVNFEGLEHDVHFTILFGSVLHSPREASDIDIVNIANKSKFVKIQKTMDKTQKTQTKKIHTINFTKAEFKQELQKKNKALIDAIKKGNVLFGENSFAAFIKELNTT